MGRNSIDRRIDYMPAPAALKAILEIQRSDPTKPNLQAIIDRLVVMGLTAIHASAVLAAGEERAMRWKLRREGVHRARAVDKVEIEDLADDYVKRLLVAGTTLGQAEIPEELVRVKRLQLKLKRASKEMK